MKQYQRHMGSKERTGFGQSFSFYPCLSRQYQYKNISVYKKKGSVFYEKEIITGGILFKFNGRL